MSNYDDPRFLRQTIDDLEKRLKKLEGSALKMAANQQGALPGTMRAVTIGDPGLGSSMWLNLSGNLPGQAPYQAVTDANKVVRAEIGNLAANGNSPAMMGFRANDASGTPIFDSLGLIKAMTLLTSAGANWGTSATVAGVAGPPTGISGFGGEAILASGGFTLARQASVFLMGMSSGYVTSTAGTLLIAAPIYVRVTGQVNGAAGSVPIYGGATLPTVGSATPFQVIQLAAGSYTANLIWNSANGTNDTYHQNNNLLYVFLMGS